MLKNEAAVIGVGDTDYAEDYRTVKEEGASTDAYGYAAQAFKRAMADAGVTRDDIDGLIASGTTSYERMGDHLGIDPRWGGQELSGKAVIVAAMALATGRAETIALVTGNNQQSAGMAYGGPETSTGPFHYFYYAPWGMTSQGAQYAMMTRRYMHEYGLTERQLGHIPVAHRKHARLNPNAIMRDPLDIDDYLDARYIVEPLRLYDYCLVNDGGAALIMTTAEQAESYDTRPVYIRGVGTQDDNTNVSQLHGKLTDFYRHEHAAVADQVYSMAGMGPDDIDAIQYYDNFSIHLAYGLEGFGFVDEGEVGAFIETGALEPGGDLPVNTSGGQTSESYLRGWGQQVEAVRQARHSAGERQVDGAENILWYGAPNGKVTSIIYSNRGAR